MQIESYVDIQLLRNLRNLSFLRNLRNLNLHVWPGYSDPLPRQRFQRTHPVVRILSPSRLLLRTIRHLWLRSSSFQAISSLSGSTMRADKTERPPPQTQIDYHHPHQKISTMLRKFTSSTTLKQSLVLSGTSASPGPFPLCYSHGICFTKYGKESQLDHIL